VSREKDDSLHVSSGVEALIDRLKTEGVNEGQQTAEKLIEEANGKAENIIKIAEEKAVAIVEQARAEAQKIQKGGQDALEIAMRDIVLKLKSRLSEVVGDRVQQLVGAELSQEAFLKELIVEVAAQARDESNIQASEDVEFHLPKSLIGLEELRRHPLELQEGSLSHFVLNVAKDVLREGVSFAQSDGNKSGLTIILKDKDISVDLTEERISSVLLEHLHPRFRAILEGMVK